MNAITVICEYFCVYTNNDNKKRPIPHFDKQNFSDKQEKDIGKEIMS